MEQGVMEKKFVVVVVVIVGFGSECEQMFKGVMLQYLLVCGGEQKCVIYYVMLNVWQWWFKLLVLVVSCVMWGGVFVIWVGYGVF